MPRAFATSLKDLEESIRESEKLKQESTGLGGLAKELKGVKETIKGITQEKKTLAKEQRSTAKDYFNTYAQLRGQGIEPELAQRQARSMTGFQGKDFISPGFEKQTRSKLEAQTRKQELGLETAEVGIKKARADIGKTTAEAKVLEQKVAQIGRQGRFTQDQIKNAAGLRKEFNTNRAVKNFDVLQRSVTGLREALDLSLIGKSRIASDQALGVLFQKMLDPNSVVRESEYARTPEGAAVLSRMQGFLPKLAKGGLALSNEDRKSIVEMGEKLLNAGIDVYNQQYDRFANLAEISGTSPRLIFGDVLTRIEKPAGEGADKTPDGATVETQEGTQEFASEEEAEAANLPAGTIITIGGRRVRVE